jgi:predicted RecB family nuclease
MAASPKKLRTCAEGHQYYKSDCPTCPVCEEQRRPQSGFLALLSAPARRALEHHDITSLQRLSQFSTKQLMAFHGFGKSSIPKLQQALKEAGMKFKDE